MSGLERTANGVLGVNRVAGAAWHPQSQGRDESGQDRLKHVLSGPCAEKPHLWTLRTRMAQWAVRSTPCRELNGRTPFEVVTGLKPQGPLHELFHRVESTHLMTIDSYVRSLQEELRKIHSEVEHYLEENYDEQLRRGRARNSHPGAVQTLSLIHI